MDPYGVPIGAEPYAGPSLPNGAKFGIIFGLVAAVLPAIFLRAFDRRPSGGMGDPLSPSEQPPPRNLFTYPYETPFDASALAAAVGAQWTAIFGDRLDAARTALLLAQAGIASSFGSAVLNWNPVNRRADRFWKEAWTARREPEWVKGQPSHRWAPIRAYTDLDEGVADWLSGLSPAVIAAVRGGSVSAFAAALAEDGWTEAPLSTYTAEVAAAVRRFRPSNEAVGLTLRHRGPTVPLRGDYGRRHHAPFASLRSRV